MIGKFADRLAVVLVRHNVIDRDDTALYAYGIHILLTNLLFLAVTCCAGAAMRVFWQSLLFYGVFRLLRRYAGGYHAATELRCTLLSTGAIVLCLGGVRLLGEASAHPLWLLFAAGASLCIACLAPLDTPAKPLEKTERRCFRRRALFCLFLTDAAYAAALLFGQMRVCAPLGFAMGLEAVLLAAGKWQALHAARRKNRS